MAVYLNFQAKDPRLDPRRAPLGDFEPKLDKIYLLLAFPNRVYRRQAGVGA